MVIHIDRAAYVDGLGVDVRSERHGACVTQNGAKCEPDLEGRSTALANPGPTSSWTMDEIKEGDPADFNASGVAELELQRRRKPSAPSRREEEKEIISEAPTQCRDCRSGRRATAYRKRPTRRRLTRPSIGRYARVAKPADDEYGHVLVKNRRSFERLRNPAPGPRKGQGSSSPLRWRGRRRTGETE